MDDQEAVQVTGVVAELWPNPPMSDTRRVFYAKALTVIPDQAAALRAVEALFVDSRFQPTPGDIIDRALGLRDDALGQWDRIVAAARDQQARRAVEHAPSADAMVALRQAGYRLADLPVNHAGALHKAHQAFVERHVERARLAAADQLELAAHATGALPAARSKGDHP